MPRAAELAAHEDLDEPMVLLIDDVDDPGADLLALRELLAKRQAADKQTVLTSRAIPEDLGGEHLRQQGR